MIPIETVSEFFGWCSVINVGLLAFSSLLLAIAGGPISRIHAAIFGLDESTLRQSYFGFLTRYKIAITVFNIVPWLALKIMS